MSAIFQHTVYELNPATLAEQELQSLSYMVSHEFAASIRHMTEFSRMLLGELGAVATPRQQQFAERIRDAGDHGSAMLEPLVVYSQVQRKTLVKVRVDVTQLVDQTLLRHAIGIRSTGTRITVEPLGDVFADYDLLALAFAALLDNAIKFRRADVTPNISVEYARENGFWRLRIRDNGLGVPVAHREEVFTMFRRLNKSGDFSGVGAGLAICRRIARRHGGDIQFLDCLEGACVELFLPCAAQRAHRSRRTAA